MFNLATFTMPLITARQTKTTDNGFPSRIPTLAEPTGVGNSAAQATASAVFDLIGDDARVDGRSERNKIVIVPFGAGADTNTFSLRVIGWRVAYDRGTARRPDTAVWIPVPLVELLCTMSTPVGVTGGFLTASDRFCDTIALTGTTANDDVDLSITSPANDTIAHAIVDCKGNQKVELIFTTGASATSCNALVAWI